MADSGTLQKQDSMAAMCVCSPARIDCCWNFMIQKYYAIIMCHRSQFSSNEVGAGSADAAPYVGGERNACANHLFLN